MPAIGKCRTIMVINKGVQTLAVSQKLGAHLYDVNEIIHGAVFLEEDVRIVNFVLLHSTHKHLNPQSLNRSYSSLQNTFELSLHSVLCEHSTPQYCNYTIPPPMRGQHQYEAAKWQRCMQEIKKIRQNWKAGVQSFANASPITSPHVPISCSYSSAWS